MADNKQMKLKIEYDNINTAEKPIQSLVNFFTNNCVLRMLNKSESEDLVDQEQLEITIKDNNCNLIDDTTVELYLGEDYDKFNGQCNLMEITLNSEPGTDPDVSLENTTIQLDEPIGLEIKDGECEIPYEDLVDAIPEGLDLNDVSYVRVKLTSEIKTSLAANIINDNHLNYGQIGIASIKYGSTSGSNDLALVQKNGTNPIIDCDTKFVKANTALKFYKTKQKAEVSEGTEFSSVDVEPISIGEIPVTITPYYNGKENIDEDIIPNFVDNSTTEDIDESVIQNCTIQKNDLPVDWKLRTTTFTLQYGENEKCDVFYKVGFCPVDGSEEIEKEVIESLKLYAFMIYDNGSMFGLRYPEWAEYKFNHDTRITLKPMWFPLYKYDDNGDATLEGIMYIELYNSEDGSKFTENVEEYHAMINRDNDGDAYNFYASLKDYMLDKGYIPSVYYNVPS